MNFKEWWPNSIIENNYVTTDSQQDMKKTLPQDKNKGMFSDNSTEARVLFYFLLLKQKLHFFQGRVLIYIFSFPPKKEHSNNFSPIWWGSFVRVLLSLVAGGPVFVIQKLSKEGANV